MIVEYPPTGPASSFAAGDVIQGPTSGLLLVGKDFSEVRTYFGLETPYAQTLPTIDEVFTLQPGAKLVTQPAS